MNENVPERCDFPNCKNEAKIRFTTADGKFHKYCSVDHTNDHRNILISELMQKT